MPPPTSSDPPEAWAPYIPRKLRDGRDTRSVSSRAGGPSGGESSSNPIPHHNDSAIFSSRTSLPLSNDPGESNSPKKKWSSCIVDFFSMKEPSSDAFAQLVKQSKEGKGGQGVLNLAGVTTAKMPSYVPPVNSKWDGLPDGWTKEDCTSPQSRRSSRRSSFKSGGSRHIVSRNTNDSSVVGGSQSRPQRHTNSSTSFTRAGSISDGSQNDTAVKKGFRSPSTDTLPEITSFFPSSDTPRRDSPTPTRSLRSASSIEGLTDAVYGLSLPSRTKNPTSHKSQFADPDQTDKYNASPVAAYGSTPYPSDRKFASTQHKKYTPGGNGEGSSKSFPAGEAQFLKVPNTMANPHGSSGDRKSPVLKGILKTQSSSSSLASRVAFQDDPVRPSSRASTSSSSTASASTYRDFPSRVGYAGTKYVNPWEEAGNGDIEMQPLVGTGVGVKKPTPVRVSLRRNLFRRRYQRLEDGDDMV